jgi:hypothetical protein
MQEVQYSAKQLIQNLWIGSAADDWPEALIRSCNASVAALVVVVGPRCRHLHTMDSTVPSGSLPD